jgi:hypothetical protein
MFFSDGFNGVPAGSVFQVSVSGDGVFGLTGMHTITRGAEVLHATLASGSFPLSTPVGPEEQHKVTFDALLGGEEPASVTVGVEVQLPDGQVVGPPPFTARLTKADKVFTVKLFANGAP